MADPIMKFFTFDEKFAEAGRDTLALEKLLAWHLRERKWFVALLIFYLCGGVALAVAGVIYFMPFWHFLHGEGGELPDRPVGLSAPVINSFGMVFLGLVAGTGAAFMHNEACIRMLLLQRGVRQEPTKPETP